MIRKDYVAIARVLSVTRKDFTTTQDIIAKSWALSAIDTTIIALADSLATNPNFDRQKFLNACNGA